MYPREQAVFVVSSSGEMMYVDPIRSLCLGEVLRLCHPCLPARASTTVADRVAACHSLCLNRPCLMYLVACW